MKKGITILEEVNMVNADDTLPAGALPEEAVYPVRVAAAAPNHRVHSHTHGPLPYSSYAETMSSGTFFANPKIHRRINPDTGEGINSCWGHKRLLNTAAPNLQ